LTLAGTYLRFRFILKWRPMRELANAYETR
jgi:hypothetical protein